MSALCEHGCQRGEPCKVIPCPALAPLRESRSMTRMKATTDPVGMAHRVIDCEDERDALAARVEELEARIARAVGELSGGTCTCEFCYGRRMVEARRILRGEDDTP